MNWNEIGFHVGVEKVAISTRKAFDALAERVKRTKEMEAAVGKRGPGSVKRWDDVVRSDDANPGRFALRRKKVRMAAKGKWDSYDEYNAAAARFMRDRTHKQVINNMARKHPGKLIAGAAALAALPIAAGVAIHKLRKKKQQGD